MYVLIFQGIYRFKVDKVYSCETSKNKPLKFNFYLRKMSLNVTEVKGNITFNIPFDNKFDVCINYVLYFSIQLKNLLL